MKMWKINLKIKILNFCPNLCYSYSYSLKDFLFSIAKITLQPTHEVKILYCGRKC